MRGDDAYAILKKKIEKNQTQPGATPEQAAQIQQNKEDIITLKGEAEKKITKIYAGSQGETHLEDSDNGPIQNMFIYGKSEQKQYLGKNLLNPTFKTDTYSGVTLTNNGDGTYTIKGTNSSSGELIFSLVPTVDEQKTLYNSLIGKKVKFIIESGSTISGSVGRICFVFYNETEIKYSNETYNGGDVTVPTGYDLAVVDIHINVGQTIPETIIKPMITTDLTATYDDFEPYVGGIPSPNPSYPQEILSVKNPVVKVCGKNLLKSTYPTTTKNGVTCTNNNDGTFSLNGTATANCVFIILGQDALKNAFGVNEKLRLTGAPKGSSRSGYYLQIWKDTPEVIYYDIGEGVASKKPNARCNVAIMVTNGTVCNNVLFKPMLTVDSTVTYDDFEPYHETEVTLPYDLYGIKVTSGGNVAINGQQYASDYFDAERGKLVRCVGKCNGDNMTNVSKYGTATTYQGWTFSCTEGKCAKQDCVCSHLILIPESQHYAGTALGVSHSYDRTNLLGITLFKSVDSVKQYFIENNVTIFYQLETPIEIDLTPEEVQALKTLATYYPVTNISVNSEQLDGYTVFNYPLPFEDEWNNVKQQVNDIKKDYLTKEDAEKEYQPKGDYATKTEIKEGYQQKGDYLTKTEADDKYQTKAEAAEEKAAVIDMIYKDKVAAATTKAEVDTLFAEWWKSQYDSDTYSKSDMLERWFGNVLVDNRVHGVKTPLYVKSTSMIGELTDDSAGLVCTPSTEAVAGNDPFDHLPQFWCLEVSAEKQADGSHVVYYVEHIDSIDDVRSGEHLCWVLQKNTWKREWKDSEYKYLKMQCKEAKGYKRWPEGKDRTGKIHEYMAHPKYPGGMKDGLITCGTGLAPVNRTSHTNIVAKWRARGKQYSGGSGSLPKFLDIMMRLKYGKKGNSGTIEGCTNYNFQYTVAVSETGVERIILTKAQAANLLVGSAVMLGIQNGTDRNTASNYSIFDGKLITKIEDVTINDTVYSAVYIDNGGKTFNTTAGSTYMSTSPYYSGWNDNVKGRDGSRYNYQNGKEPGMLQGVEFMHGSYIIVSDELWQWGTDADGNYTFDCFKCYDQSKVSSSITSDYVKMDVPTLKFPQGTASWIWKYITDNAINDDVMWPETTDASGSGVGVGAGFRCVPASSGVRAAWVFGNLSYGGGGGVPCRRSGSGPSTAHWGGSSGAPGSEG